MSGEFVYVVYRDDTWLWFPNFIICPSCCQGQVKGTRRHFWLGKGSRTLMLSMVTEISQQHGKRAMQTLLNRTIPMKNVNTVVLETRGPIPENQWFSYCRLGKQSQRTAEPGWEGYGACGAGGRSPWSSSICVQRCVNRHCFILDSNNVRNTGLECGF